jgi:hypothetical protein
MRSAEIKALAFCSVVKVPIQCLATHKTAWDFPQAAVNSPGYVVPTLRSFLRSRLPYPLLSMLIDNKIQYTLLSEVCQVRVC